MGMDGENAFPGAIVKASGSAQGLNVLGGHCRGTEVKVTRPRSPRHDACQALR